MGLWELFQGEDHAPRYAARSLWGGSEPASADSICDPMGPDGTSIAPVSMRGCDGTRSAAEPLWWRLRT